MDCLFCKIVKKEIPAQILFEDERVLAFNDINPAAPIHVLIIPKKHIKDMDSLEEEDFNLLGHIFQVIQKISRDKGISHEGYRVVNNCKEKGGQTVDHLHFHLLGQRQLLWPPG